MPILSNPRHEAFAQAVAKGDEPTSTYARIYRVKGRDAAAASASRLLSDARYRVAARITEMQRSSATATTLTMQERREYFARVVRAKLHELDLTKDGDLIQEIIDNEQGRKVKLPGKRECIMDDAKLAGEIVEPGTTVNVGVAVNVLTAERQQQLMERKAAAVQRLRARQGGERAKLE